MILPALIARGDHEWAPIYDPARKPVAVASAREYARENLGVAATWRNV